MPVKQEVISQIQFAKRLGCATSQISKMVQKKVLRIETDRVTRHKGLNWLPALRRFANYGNERSIILLREIKDGEVRGKFIYRPKSKTQKPVGSKNGSGMDIDKLDFNDMDAVDAKQALEIIKVKKALLDLKEKEGRFIDIEIAKRTFSAIASSVKKKLLAMPNRVASLMENCDYKARHRILVDELNIVLDGLSIDLLQIAGDISKDLEKEKKKLYKREERSRKKEGKK